MSKKLLFCIIILILLLYYGYWAVSIYSNHYDEREIISLIQSDVIVQDDSLYDNNMADIASGQLKRNNKDTDILTSTSNQMNDANVYQEELPLGFDCILQIPSINLHKIVYTGKMREKQLQQYNLITAAEDMRYCNGGNYIICGHNSQLYGHSMNRLREVKVGEQVSIQWNGLIHRYRVHSVEYKKMTDTSSYCQQTGHRELTIISCAKDVGKDHYIVIQCQLTE